MSQITLKNPVAVFIQDTMNLATQQQKPFHSTAWQAWQENRPRLPNPTTVRQQIRDLALQGQHGSSPMSLEEVNELYPKKSPELDAQIEVYNTWQEGVKQYSSRHIHRQTQTLMRYNAWRQAKLIPEALDLYEYWFLTEWFIALGNSKVQKINPLNYKHVAPVGIEIGRKFKSKVGNTYRDWLLMECVSEDEQLSKPLYYRAMCRACGHIIEKFNYSRVAQPCGNCEKLAKAIKISAAPLPERLVEKPSNFAPINLWQTPEGWVAQFERPFGASAKMVLQEFGTPIAVEKLSDEEPDTPQQNPQQNTQQEKKSSFEEAFPTLDLPNF